MLPTTMVCERYKITRRGFGRWLTDPQLGFPKPITINGRHYFDETELEGWERQRAAASRKTAKRPPALEPRQTAA